MHLGFGTTIETLPVLGVDNRGFFPKGDDGFQTLWLDALRDQEVDNAIGPTKTQIGIVGDVTHTVGVTKDAELHIRMFKDPLGLSLESFHGFSIEGIFVKSEIHNIGRLRLKLPL